jgi:hypothetical protein
MRFNIWVILAALLALLVATRYLQHERDTERIYADDPRKGRTWTVSLGPGDDPRRSSPAAIAREVRETPRVLSNHQLPCAQLSLGVN